LPPVKMSPSLARPICGTLADWLVSPLAKLAYPKARLSSCTTIQIGTEKMECNYIESPCERCHTHYKRWVNHPAGPIHRDCPVCELMAQNLRDFWSNEDFTFCKVCDSYNTCCEGQCGRPGECAKCHSEYGCDDGYR
jgi:hypothetical protein